MYCAFKVFLWTLLLLLFIRCKANKIRSYAASVNTPLHHNRQCYHPSKIDDDKLFRSRLSQDHTESNIRNQLSNPLSCRLRDERSSVIPTNCLMFSTAARDFIGCKVREDIYDLQNRIVRGSDVNITEVPYQVNYDGRCGAAILSEYWVITACHCRTTGKYVTVGSTKQDTGIVHNVEKHFPHPKFNSKSNKHPFNYDFLLLKLVTPIVMSKYTAPVQIGDMNDIVSGAVLSITGWGDTTARYSPANILQRVEVPIIARNQCQMTPHSLYCITETMFCAGYPEGGKDACQGDSGGPATVNGKLVGLVSFGSGCAQANVPGVYSMVPFVKDWISAVTGLQI